MQNGKIISIYDRPEVSASALHKCFRCGQKRFEDRLKSYQVPKSISRDGFAQICDKSEKCLTYRKFLEGTTINLIWEEEANG